MACWNYLKMLTSLVLSNVWHLKILSPPSVFGTFVTLCFLDPIYLEFFSCLDCILFFEDVSLVFSIFSIFRLPGVPSKAICSLCFLQELAHSQDIKFFKGRF